MTGLLLQSGSDVFVIPLTGGGTGGGDCAEIKTMGADAVKAVADRVFGTTHGTLAKPQLGMGRDAVEQLAERVFS